MIALEGAQIKRYTPERHCVIYVIYLIKHLLIITVWLMGYHFSLINAICVNDSYVCWSVIALQFKCCTIERLCLVLVLNSINYCLIVSGFYGKHHVIFKNISHGHSTYLHPFERVCRSVIAQVGGQIKWGVLERHFAMYLICSVKYPLI